MFFFRKRTNDGYHLVYAQRKIDIEIDDDEPVKYRYFIAKKWDETDWVSDNGDSLINVEVIKILSGPEIFDE